VEDESPGLARVGFRDSKPVSGLPTIRAAGIPNLGMDGRNPAGSAPKALQRLQIKF
jgi:hypothetical protein